MSTTSDKEIALRYSAMGEQSRLTLPMVLELTVSAIDRGACIQDFSQYPHEVEYLWVPCSFVAPNGPESMEVSEHGVVRIVPVRVNSNLTARTLDQLLVSKKQAHLAAFRYTIQEVRQELSKKINKHGASRIAADFYREFAGHKYTCDGLVGKIMDECMRRLDVHKDIEADKFANDEIFRHLVTEMLNVKTMAKSKLKLWLYDLTECIMQLESVSLRNAHRKYLGFLRKSMLVQSREQRRDTALKMCSLKGLIATDVDEVDDIDLGETKLESASADGVGSGDLKLLIQAAILTVGDDKLSQALMKASEFGHVHCIEVLLAAQANVCFKNCDSVFPLFIASQNGHLDAVKMLLGANADVSDAGERGCTPLYVAARNGHVDVLRALLDGKANVNSVAENGYTPLCIAAQNGQVKAVELLSQYGGNEALMWKLQVSVLPSCANNTVLGGECE
jgi:hypothetical protein